MLTLKEAKKIPYEQLDRETQEYVYGLFNLYNVRKQIAENNKALSKRFGTYLGTIDPREYSRCFNTFNSAFIGCDLIKELEYDEIHTSYLRDMSEDRFNAHLNSYYNSFERKMALICFSTRQSERIANRVDLPVMVAYANMQFKVLEALKANPKGGSLSTIITDAADDVRREFYETHGYKLNQSEVAETRTDYKSVGKKAAPIWKSMLECYKQLLRDYRSIEAADFIFKSFVFTEHDKRAFMSIYDTMMNQASRRLEMDRQNAKNMAELFPGYYNQADYDEAFGRGHAEEVFSEYIESGMDMLLDKYLTDPIYEEKPKEKKQKGEN